MHSKEVKINDLKLSNTLKYFPVLMQPQMCTSQSELAKLKMYSVNKVKTVFESSCCDAAERRVSCLPHVVE